MDVISFIEKDASRARLRSRLTWFLSGGIAFALPVALGIFLREGFEGVLEPRTFVPNILGATLIFFLSLAALKPSGRTRRLLITAFAGVALGVFLATDRVFFPLGERTFYLSNSSFWHENARCFVKGGTATFVEGCWLTFCAFATSAWPSRRWRVLLSAMAGASGAIMLGFHCDSSSASHVLIAHVGQGFILGALVFGLQEGLFQLGLKRSFPDLASKLKSFHRIG